MATKKNTAIKHGDKEYNYFRITRTVGHEWKDGKKIPIRKQFYGTSKGDAEKQFRAYQDEQLQKKYEQEHADDEKRRITFGEYAEEYTYQVLPRSNLANSTADRYEQSYRAHVKDTWIMSVPIGEINAQKLQDFYLGLDVSKQTLKAVNKWMSAFYKWIAISGIMENVQSVTVLPDKPDNSRHNEIQVWEPDEMHAILNNFGTNRLKLMMIIMNYTGLRISECFGLKYSDIGNGFLSVNRQYYKGKICPPKYKSYRKLPLHPEVEKALEIHKERFTAEAKRKGYETEYIFTTVTGNLLEYGNVRRALNRYYTKIRVPKKSPHTYRATFCTELCRAGVPLEVASKLMGHKSIEVTAKHYALVKQDVQIEAINKLPGIAQETRNKFTVVKPKKKPRKIIQKI